MDPSMEDNMAKRIEDLREIKSSLDSLLSEDITDVAEAAAILNANAMQQISTMEAWVGDLRQREAHLAEERQKAEEEIRKLREEAMQHRADVVRPK